MIAVKKKHRVFKILIIVLIILLLLFLVMEFALKEGIFNDNENLYGANGNAMSYINDINPQKYSSLNEALVDIDEKLKSENKICQIEDNGIVHVYMQGQNNIKFEEADINRTDTYIKCYDFVTTSDGYNYSGERKLVINFNDDKKYTWKETFLADLFISRDSAYRGAVEKKYKVLPAWGVTDNSDIKDVTVDGQKIDEVHELDVDGETYYLWIINDLKTQNKSADIIK